MFFWSFSYRLSIRKVRVRGLLFTTTAGLQPKILKQINSFKDILEKIFSKNCIKCVFCLKNYKTSFISSAPCGC